jgi:hypothetical protein
VKAIASKGGNMSARIVRIVVSAALVAALPAAMARAGDAPPPARAEPEALRALKKLVGTWQGSAQMGGKAVPVTIVYEATAGGSAVLERLFPGTPHEMVSVYAAEGGGVAMTHYCAMGNHPKMTLTKATARELSFELAGTEGLRSATEPHMHAVTVSFVDGEHIRETWTSFEGGKLKEQKAFELARASK